LIDLVLYFVLKILFGKYLVFKYCSKNTFPKYFYNTDDQPTPAIPATEDNLFNFADQAVGAGHSEARANKVTIECPLVLRIS